jgi:TIR domain
MVMTDVFVSYSTADLRLAEFLQRHLQSEGLSVFLASTSLMPGQKWPQEILNALNNARWVLFLASRAACQSPWVQQELGVALARNKKLVPIVWDMAPRDLPGWVAHFQPVDLRGANADAARAAFSAIAEQVKADKRQGAIIAGLLLAGLFIAAK